MRIIMVIVLLSLCFNVFSSGEMEIQPGQFEIVYEEILTASIRICIIRVKITGDLFLMTIYQGDSVDMLKLDSKYSEFIKGE